MANKTLNVVLVHGGFVDGSGWLGVYDGLRRQGYPVTVVQNPTISLADDVEVTRRAIAQLQGPVILVGHSNGGGGVTEPGNDPRVVGLVYIAAFAPDAGESVSSLIQNPPPGAPVPPILPPQDGYLFLDKAKFSASFAADVALAEAVCGHHREGCEWCRSRNPIGDTEVASRRERECRQFCPRRPFA